MTRAALVLLSTVALGGCTGVGGLSEREAEQVLQKRFALVSAGACRLSLVKQRPDGTFSITDDSGSATACFDQVIKAGFGQRGDCRDKDGGARPRGTCIDRTVVPLGGARGRKDGFSFPCGTLTLIEVESMQTLGEGLVSVTYRREFEAKPVASQLGYCRDGELAMPDRGTRTKSLSVSKQSDGSWAIDQLDPFSSVHVL